MRIILATGCNKAYFEKEIFKNYLNSITKNSKSDLNLVFTVDFLPEKQDNLEFSKIDSSKIKVPNSNFCLQHGAFLESSSFSFSDDDILIFTDGDIILQRWFEDEELDWVKNISSQEVIAGYNMSCYNTAKKSIQHTGMQQSLQKECSKILEVPLEEIPDYNTGVVIAKISAWKKILEDYNKIGPLILPMIPGFWGQQFVLNAVFARKTYHKRMPYQIHTHTHHLNQVGFGMPVLPEMTNGEVFYRKKLIMFAHRFFGFESEYSL